MNPTSLIVITDGTMDNVTHAVVLQDGAPSHLIAAGILQIQTLSGCGLDQVVINRTSGEPMGASDFFKSATTFRRAS